MERLDQLLLAQLASDDILIDVGAGSGEVARAAAAKGVQVIAIDPSARRCQDLAAVPGITVIEAALGQTTGTAKYVERVRRTLVTNARDAAIVSVTTLDQIVADHHLGSTAAIRIRAVGRLGAVLRGGVSAVATSRMIRVVGDAIAGDNAADVAALLVGNVTTRSDTEPSQPSAATGRLIHATVEDVVLERPAAPLIRIVAAATVAGIVRWLPDYANVASHINWLTPVCAEDAPLADDDQMALIIAAEARAIDPSRRSRLASVLNHHPELYSYPSAIPGVADLLDELALDPDPATWRAAGWWRARLAEYDDATRNRRRHAAFERLVDSLTGPKSSRPAPFPSLR